MQDSYSTSVVSSGQGKLALTHLNARQSITVLLLKITTLEIIELLLIGFLGNGLLSFLHVFTNTALSIVVIFLVISIFKTLLAILIVFQWLNTYYEITPTGITQRTGVFFVSEEYHPYTQLRDLELNQSSFGKIGNYGTLRIYNYDLKKYFELYLIHNPTKYYTLLQELMPKASFERHTPRVNIKEEDENKEVNY